MADLFHECGIAAVYHFDREVTSEVPAVKKVGPDRVSRLIPRMLLDIQNRGQLAAGMTTYNPASRRLLATHKDVGTVTEVFRMSRKLEYQELMESQTGHAAIGHVRYATCGRDDKNYAQPFEREHLEKRKWFSFGFNGQLANYLELRDEIQSHGDFHLARETDTETMMHLLSREISRQESGLDLREMLRNVSERLDGAYTIAFVNACGDMVVSRDPLGFRPLCYGIRDGFFAAASESVALATLGFEPDEIKDLDPGCAIFIQNGELSIERYAPETSRAHCFFEWIYFANVCSNLDGRSVYLTRKALGEELAQQEKESTENAIVVPVPDTAKAAAEGMAFNLHVPCLEGLMRHRALGRTFIEGEDREDKARMKYIPLPEVLRGKKIFLVDDTIVRSTTMKVLVRQLFERGQAAEVHVRVACPPIVAPCFYGIDMSGVEELFATEFLPRQTPADSTGQVSTPRSLTIDENIEKEMAKQLGATSLRYLPLDSISRAIKRPSSDLCRACLTGEYPTAAGNELYNQALCLCQAEGGRAKSGRHVESKPEELLQPARL